MDNMQIEYWPIDRLTPYCRNPRKNDEVVPKMAGLIREFGFKVPVVVRSDGEVVDGHLRLKAARHLGMETVPVVLADEWTEAQVKAFRIAVNKSAEWAEWDEELLSLELEDLKADGFDLGLIGVEDIINAQPTDGEQNAGGGSDDKYTAKIDIPQYEPTGKHVELLGDCCKTERYEELVKAIDASACPDGVKTFLRLAATRHIEFNYRDVAEYYANDADAETQALFERLALVIIDYEDALKHGYVKISKVLESIVGAGDE